MTCSYFGRYYSKRLVSSLTNLLTQGNRPTCSIKFISDPSEGSFLPGEQPPSIFFKNVAESSLTSW